MGETGELVNDDEYLPAKGDRVGVTAALPGGGLQDFQLKPYSYHKSLT